MRITNMRQLANVPMVDAGDLYLDRQSRAIEARRLQIQRRERDQAIQAQRAQAAAVARRKAEEAQRLAEAQRYEAMMKRSMRRGGHDVVAAAKLQGLGFVSTYGVKNPLLGFVDEVDEPDFETRHVYNAPQFNNHLTARVPKAYIEGKDWPLVLDAPKGDFGSVLKSESTSPDFAHLIVHDVRSDFGYVPKPRRR